MSFFWHNKVCGELLRSPHGNFKQFINIERTKITMTYIRVRKSQDYPKCNGYFYTYLLIGFR